MLRLVSTVPTMPPKKVTPERKVLLGRPGNNLKIGIVGPLSVPSLSRSPAHLVCRAAKRREIVLLQCPLQHRSALDVSARRFSSLLRSRQGRQFSLRDHQSRGAFYSSANKPSCIFRPQEARIPVPDPRFDWLCDLYKPVSRVPAFLTCIDIAGLTAVRRPLPPPNFFFLSFLTLVKGASTGAGLGNAFLSHVRSVDGIFQVVRAFDDAEVIHVEGELDPLRDMNIIQNELRLKDIEWVEKALDTLKKSGRSLGSSSLADKARKEEIVRRFIRRPPYVPNNTPVGHRRENSQDALRRQQGRPKGGLDQ